MKKILETLKLKWAEYLLEILVIIIGILLAFMLNDWNDSRKQKMLEIELLHTIKSDLESALEELEGDMAAILESQNSGYIFKEFLMNEPIFRDSMLLHYERLNNDRQTRPKTLGYASLKSMGMDIISNDSLRLEITDTYEGIFPRIIEAGQSTEKFDIQKLLYPYYKKHFILSDEQSDWKGLSRSLVAYKYKIKDYEKLRADNEFLIDLQRSFEIRDRKIWLGKRGVRQIEKVMLQLDKELEQLE